MPHDVASPTLVPVLGTLHALRVPIAPPLREVTVLIDTASPVTLVDTALDLPGARAAIEDGLRQLGLHWESIERVIVTHHHPDHYGLAGLVEARSGAGVFMLDTDIERGEWYWTRLDEALPDEARVFRDHGAPPAVMAGHEQEAREMRAQVHPAVRLHPLTAGQTLRLAGHDWTVLWLPGHADGHLGLWQPQTRTLIAGDAVLPRISPIVPFYAYSRPDPLGDFLASLAQIERLDPRLTVVGHGGPLLEGAAERARELTRHHAARLEVLLKALDDAGAGGGEQTAHTLSHALFPRELDASGRRFALAETIAHAEYLRHGGVLERRWDAAESAWRYCRR